MERKSRWQRALSLNALLAALVAAFLLAPNARAEDEVAPATYKLRYKFSKGESVRKQVIHLATTETRIQGNLQTSRSRGVSVKEWRIKDVDDKGAFTFEHRVTQADMSSEVSGRPKVSYNSEIRDDKPVPDEYQAVDKSIGEVIAVVTASAQGEIIDREQTYRQYNFGLGQMVFPLPEEAVSVGHEWHHPVEITVGLKDGQRKRIKTRQRYKLTKVAHGLATIEVMTQVLTPVNDPHIEVQLVQQLTHGSIKFDIDAGRVRHQRMDWDEKVVGFNGADSVMEYLARFEEKLIDNEANATGKTAATAPVESPVAGPAAVKTARKPDDKDKP